MPDNDQTIRIEIYDHVYKLHSSADDDYTRELAKAVDATMRRLSEKTQTIDSLRLAVLAAMHFADQYSRLKTRYDKLNGSVTTKSARMHEVLDALYDKDTRYEKAPVGKQP